MHGLSLAGLVSCALIRLDRNHWSLFPVVFEGRSLLPDVYDELIGILAHGCIGEPMTLG